MAAHIDCTTNLSEYAKNLKGDMLARYKMKINLCDGKEPYTLKKCDFSYDIGDYPAVTFYTAKQMKAFKSMEAYNFFISGWGKEVGTKVLKTNYRLIVGRISAINSSKIFIL